MAGVVVGLDRSPRSGPALDWAAQEARRRGASLTLLHAWSVPVDICVNDGALALLGAGTGVTSCAFHGPPDVVLLAQRPELLVLGGRSHGRGVGHVVRACLRRATCPVVVVPGTSADDDQPAASGRVVVGVCGTSASRAALQWGATEAVLRGGQLVLVHVWQSLPASVSEVLRPSHVAAARALAADGRLREWSQSARSTSDEVVLQSERGAPLDVLLQHSGTADLLVLGRPARRRAGLLHEALGEEVAALAACPVVLVPAASPVPGAQPR